MEKTIITFVLLAMVTLVPAVGFASENSSKEIKHLNGVSWGESYHEFSEKYSIRPILEACEINLDKKINLYGQEMDTKAIAYFNNDRLFMMQYCFPEKLTDEEFDKVTKVITKELGELVAEDKNKEIGKMIAWKNDDELVALNKEGIYYLGLSLFDTDNVFSLERMNVLSVKR